MCHRFSPVPVRFNPVYRLRRRWFYQWDGVPVGPFQTEAEAEQDLRWHSQHPADGWILADPVHQPDATERALHEVCECGPNCPICRAMEE